MADKISWIDSNGTEQLLSHHPNFKVLKGMNGRFMPPVSFAEEEVPFQSGSRHRETKVLARDIDIPLLIQTSSELELRQKVREFLRMFNPLKGDGRIKSIAPDGSQREIYCRYSTGLEGNEGSDTKGNVWQTLVLVFHAFDPYWYDSMTQVQTFKINESPGTFFPFFPLRLSSSTVFASIDIDNTGDVEAYPEWIITGPGENIVFRNLTTGERTSITYSLDIGESIIIDTRPYHKTVTKNDRANLFYTLSDDSSLWSLQEGQNSIQLEMSNSTIESSIQLSYKNRYWGA